MRTTVLLLLGLAASPTALLAGTPSDGDMTTMLDSYCTKCHNSTSAKAGVVLDNLDGAKTAAAKAVKELTAGKMPPSSATQPSQDDHDAMLAWFQANAPTEAGE